MTSLIAACAFFIGIHVVISSSPLRGVIVRRIGERPYLGCFSLLSAAALTWLILAYSRAEGPWLWNPPLVLRWLAPPLMLVAAAFVVIGLTTASPTVAGGEQQLDSADAARGVLRITRHPFLLGVALWAATHLALNGDAPSLVLFGSLLILSLIGPLLIDAKRRRAFGAKWQRFAAVTSNVPFAAIVSGRNTLRLGEIGAWRFALTAVVWVALMVLHPWLFGVRALP